MKKKKTKYVTFSFRMTDDLAKKLRDQAEKLNLPQGWIIRNLIEKFLGEQ